MAEAMTCAHHWILPTPEGPTIDGECRLCGARKTFRSYADELADFRTTATGRHIPKSQRERCPRCSKPITKEYIRKHRQHCGRKRA